MSPSFLGLPFPNKLIPSVPLTDEQLIQFSEANKPCKIERNRDGEIIVMTPVGGIGSTHEASVGLTLYVWNEGVGTGQVFFANAGFNLADGSCFSPDAAWLSLARWNAPTPQQQIGYPPLCPEFVIEVHSRSDGRRGVEEKMERWLENGAELSCLIDPITGDVMIYKQGETPQRIDRPEVVMGCDRWLTSSYARRASGRGLRARVPAA